MRHWFELQDTGSHHHSRGASRFVTPLVVGNKPPNAFAMHVDNDDSLKWGLTASLGRTQQTIFIKESGLYHPFVELPNARDALRKHVDREDKGVAICDTLGGRQQTTVLIQHSGSNYKTQVVIITAEGRHY